MVASIITGIKLAGLVSCLPPEQEDVAGLAIRFGPEAAQRIAKATGIRSRHLAGPSLCTSDLAAVAATRLLAGLGWAADSIQVFILVSQTQDHLLPASSFLLHQKLGLSRNCAVFDQGLGCSGFVYGLWTAAGLLKTLTGTRKRALLLVGDTTSRLCGVDDRAVAPLFGDAAVALGIECYEYTSPGDLELPIAAITFNLGSDGAGAPYLMVPGGGMRHPTAPRQLFMDGTQVFAFTLREVPASIEAVLQSAGWSLDSIDHVVLHQANAQMIRHLGQKIGARPEQVVVALADYGNTSSASVPLALTTHLAPALTSKRCRLILSGFGVGWSWASAALECGPLALCETLIYPTNSPAASAAVTTVEAAAIEPVRENSIK